MKHILMIDDVTTNLKCATEVLKDTYQITTAKSGKQALVLLKDITPDIILLDINMPDMNGFEVMMKIRENLELADIPIIFLTAETDQDNEVKGLEMGAMDFIRKPFEPDVMRSRIDKIIQMKEKNERLESIAQKDGLTDLLNRRYMEKLLNQTNDSEKRGYFFLLDMDNFKQVNDTFGHIVGDDVLIRFAKVLKEEVGASDCVSRIGGDEFAVYIDGEYDIDRIKSIARRMIAGIEFEVNNLLSDECDFKISASIGISQKPEDGTNFSELYAAADKALYYVKQNGKRGYHFYGKIGEANGTCSADESTQIDLLQLQRLIQEKDNKNGVYRVEYDGFKRIYHFVARCMERKSQDMQLVLFTLNCAEGYENENLILEKYMPVLETAISKSLRRGDVATKCGNAQFVAILIDASCENGNMVAKRIAKKFESLLDDNCVALSYEMQSIHKSK